MTYTYASQFKDHISLDDEESLLEDMLRKCAGDMAPKSESYGVYYVSCGAALYQDENTVYLESPGRHGGRVKTIAKNEYLYYNERAKYAERR